MIKTINPYSTAMTAEIMSRYRPIAPKPEAANTNSTAENQENSAVPNGIRKSPYLRNVWANLQARPTRTRKRGRTAAFGPPASVKRTRTCLQGLSPPYQVTNSPAKNLAMHGFTHAGNDGLAQISLLPNLVPLKCGLDTAVTTLAESVALPLLRCNAAQYAVVNRGKEIFSKGIDLNLTADQASSSAAAAPEEVDFLPQLDEPAKPRIISPRPVRPVHSSIIVKSIEPVSYNTMEAAAAAEVEAAVESETVPGIVSDSNNKVRISNSAYKEMVGQPECCWLDCAGAAGGACKRIGGEVLLEFVDCEVVQVSDVHGFNCGVTIEWESNGIKKSVNAFCSVAKLSCCQKKDYQFLWKFYNTSEAASSKSKSKSAA